MRQEIITPATIYVKVVIPAKAGIQNWTGCRIKSGMTILDMFICRSNNKEATRRNFGFEPPCSVPVRADKHTVLRAMGAKIHAAGIPHGSSAEE